MNPSINETTFNEKIKRIAAYRGYNLTSLGREFNRRFGTKYTDNSFYRKLRDATFRYDELKKLGEILNFDIDFKIND